MCRSLETYAPYFVVLPDFLAFFVKFNVSPQQCMVAETIGGRCRLGFASTTLSGIVGGNFEVSWKQKLVKVDLV